MNYIKSKIENDVNLFLANVTFFYTKSFFSILKKKQTKKLFV